MNKDKQKVVLEIDNLKKYFIHGSNVNKAVDSVSFNVHESEIVGLIGESGSGKTTVGRSLMRLYDDYNGFVRLDGRIVSGRKISRDTEKFLRRNVQMIFQDPHASLNGQKNIFSTLKEPLVVNGIMREKMKDLFSDWRHVKKNFRYTFKSLAQEYEIINLSSFNNIAKDFVVEWENKFNNLTFDSQLSNEDNFNQYFAFLEEKQSMETEVINTMYSNTNKLIDFYYQKQKDYREDNIDLDEIELRNALKNYNNAKLGLRYTNEQVKLYHEYKNIRSQYKALKKEHSEFLKVSKNAFTNYIYEFKNEKNMLKNSRLLSTNLDFYIYNLKRELINSKANEFLKEVYPELKYLEFEQIKALIKHLREYMVGFYRIKLNVEYSKQAKQLLQETIDSEFNFNIDEYLKQSKTNKANFDKRFKDIESQIAFYIENLAPKTVDKAQAKQDLNKAKQRLSLAEDSYQKRYIQHVSERKELIAATEAKIVEINETYYALRKQIKELVKRFKSVHKNFIQYLKNQEVASEKVAKKQQKYEIISFNTVVNAKLETQKSFAIEYRYLVKDIHNIDLLLGINHNLVDIIFKDKYPKLRFIYSNYIFAPFAWIRLKNLFYKTIIYKALEDVGLLKQFAYRYPHEFSGGQRQRIVIARALITQPKVIIADEPIASLDISIQAQVVNLLKDLCKEKNIGLIFIAHDLSMIEYIADKVQIMHLGKIVESGDTEQIYAHPVHPYTINLFKAIPKISNANEKFENVSFELNYLEQQKFPNVPKTWQIGQNHFVYGTNQQVHEWTKEISDVKTLKLNSDDDSYFEELILSNEEKNNDK
ncbi:ATP-binding cassette domain-containing protein [Mycoplasma sp. 3341]|uniref:ATP-binding cassette domain-containing protein n=1 Tax=Mycoplasma sp. 3341 TaxID=3447506 RepID=UPI003F66081C